MKNAIKVIDLDQGKTYNDCFEECVTQDWCKMFLSLDDTSGASFCQLMDIDFVEFKALAAAHTDGFLVENFTATQIKNDYDE